MHYNSMLESLKAEMHCAIDAIELEDDAGFEQFRMKNDAHLDILKQLYILRARQPVRSVAPVKPLSEIIDSVDRQTKVSDSEPTEPVSDSLDDTDDDTSFIVVPLERTLKGGILRLSEDTSDDVTEFLPEHRLREMVAEHGDLIRIDTGVSLYDPDRYSVYERQTDHKLPDAMHVIERAVVEYNDMLSTYTATSYVDRTGRVCKLSIDRHGRTFFKLHNKDTASLNVSVGDIVDIAYYTGKEFARVRWLHDTEPVSSSGTPAQKSTYYKNNGTKDADDVPQIFDGLTISIFGADSRLTAYRDEVEKRGGSLVAVTSDNATLIENAVATSDIVVLPIRESSHVKCEIAKAEAKRRGVPFAVLDGAGRSLLVRTITEVLPSGNK